MLGLGTFFHIVCSLLQECSVTCSSKDQLALSTSAKDNDENMQADYVAYSERVSNTFSDIKISNVCSYFECSITNHANPSSIWLVFTLKF